MADPRQVAKAVELHQLDPQQLLNAKQRIEEDIQRFAESANFLSKSASIYMGASTAIKQLAESSEGQEILVPLTQSLYVSGTVASTEHVLIDVGTNYYVEMTADGGQEYCKRKVDKLRANINDLQEILRQKQNQLMQVEKVLAMKMAEMRPAAASS